jgi:hypothetical protein
VGTKNTLPGTENTIPGKNTSREPETPFRELDTPNPEKSLNYSQLEGVMIQITNHGHPFTKLLSFGIVSV